MGNKVSFIADKLPLGIMFLCVNLLGINNILVLVSRDLFLYPYSLKGVKLPFYSNNLV